MYAPVPASDRGPLVRITLTWEELHCLKFSGILHADTRGGARLSDPETGFTFYRVLHVLSDRGLAEHHEPGWFRITKPGLRILDLLVSNPDAYRFYLLAQDLPCRCTGDPGIYDHDPACSRYFARDV